MAEQSITVSFIADESELTENQILAVALDEERNGGETRFLYGEKAYFQVFTHPAGLALSITPSDGIITNEGNGSLTVEETLTFANAVEASTQKPVDAIVSAAWQGNNLGAVSAAGTVITCSKTGVGVLKLEYTARFRRYAISIGGKDEDEFNVTVLVSGGGS